MKREDVLRAIIAKNGEAHQLTVVVEELAELTKEVTKRIRNGGGNDVHICEEIADVELVLAELKLMVPLSRTHVPMYSRFKYARLKTVYIDGGEK